jgi:ribokinase
VVGDTTLDVTVRGATAVAGSDRPARIDVGPGGQGANVAVRLARRGARVVLVTALADDAAGQQLRARLAADGVACVALPADHSAVVVSLVDGAGERAMLSDRRSFDPDGLRAPAVTQALAGADWIHVSGYPLSDPRSGEVLVALAAARGSGQRCSVGGGSFAAEAGAGDRIRATRPDLLLFDRREASVLLGEAATAASPSAETLAAALTVAFGCAAVVTDGLAGASAATPEGSAHVDGLVTAGASLAPAVDATGAGDAHAAVMLTALAPGPWPPPLPAVQQALESAARLGAEVAAAVGAQARVALEGAS